MSKRGNRRHSKSRYQLGHYRGARPSIGGQVPGDGGNLDLTEQKEF